MHVQCYEVETEVRVAFVMRMIVWMPSLNSLVKKGLSRAKEMIDLGLPHVFELIAWSTLRQSDPPSTSR